MVEDDKPKSDVDIPVEDHIEELLARLLIVCSIGISVALISLPVSDLIIDILWNIHIPSSQINRPRIYSPFALIFTRFKLIFLISLLITLPILIYQSYKFMSIGLYKNEEYYFKQVSGLSVILSFISLLVSNLILIPFLFEQFNNYSDTAADIAYGLQDTIGLMLIIMIYLVLVFHIPILMVLAINLDLVDHNWIRSRRIVFWILFFTVSFISSPDPTGMIPVLIGIIMIILFEITLFVIKWYEN